MNKRLIAYLLWLSNATLRLLQRVVMPLQQALRSRECAYCRQLYRRWWSRGTLWHLCPRCVQAHARRAWEEVREEDEQPG